MCLNGSTVNVSPRQARYTPTTFRGVGLVRPYSSASLGSRWSRNLHTSLQSPDFSSALFCHPWMYTITRTPSVLLGPRAFLICSSASVSSRSFHGCPLSLYSTKLIVYGLPLVV